MRLKNLDLIIAVTIAAMNVIWALLPYHILVIGIILALPLVFVLPGYTLVEALLHKHSLDTSKRLVFSIALSLAIDILSGFILNLLPIGLQAKSWAMLLGLLTALFSLLAAYLRRGALDNRARRPGLGLSIYDSILLVLAVVVIIQSLVYSTIGAAYQPQASFTQLWLLPPAQTGKICTVQLGIRSFETVPVTYDLTLTMNQTEVATWPSIALATQEEWSRMIPIVSKTADKAYIEARLYRSDKPKSVYQQVDLTLTGGGEDPCLRSSSNLKSLPAIGYGTAKRTDWSLRAIQ